MLRCEERKRAVESPLPSPANSLNHQLALKSLFGRNLLLSFCQFEVCLFNCLFDVRIKRTGNGVDGTRGIIGNVAINRKPIEKPGRHQWRPGKLKDRG